MALAIFLPLNSLFRSNARIKPTTVDTTTTTTVHTTVFHMTILKAGFPVAAIKLSNPVNPLTIPALVTWLNAILKTMPIGSAMNKAMRTQLGRIQIYGSINRYFFFIDILCFLYSVDRTLLRRQAG